MNQDRQTMNSRKHPQKGEEVGIAPTSQPYFSAAVRVDAGPLLFVTGMVGRDAKRNIVNPGDVRAQTRQALTNLRNVLQANDADLDDLASITVYCVDFRHFEGIAEVRREFFQGNGPASCMVQVSGLAHPDLLLEISCVAVVG